MSTLSETMQQIEEPVRPLILVVASTFPADTDDGTPAFIRDLSLQLSEQFRVVVLTPAVPGAVREEQIGHVRVVRFRFFPRRWEDLADGAMLENVRTRPSRLLQVPFLLVAEAWSLTRLVRRLRPDALHVHWLIPQGLVSLVVPRSVPRLLTTLGGDLYALDSRPFRWLKRRVVASATAVTVMNRDMAHRIIALGADPEIVHVLPMGASIRPTSVTQDVPARSDRQLVFAGRLVEKKGAAIFVDALRSLVRTHGFSAVIIGDGPLRGALGQHAHGLPVRFAGQVPRHEMVEVFSSSAIAVFPSVRSTTGDQDGLPVAMLEAMGAGAAVVASDLPGIDEVVEHDVTGLLTAPGEAEALATALGSLLDDADRRARLAHAGKELVTERYTVDAVGRSYRDLFRSLIGVHLGTDGTAAGP